MIGSGSVLGITLEAGRMPWQRADWNSLCAAEALALVSLSKIVYYPVDNQR
jgi:hypothetical protein